MGSVRQNGRQPAKASGPRHGQSLLFAPVYPDLVLQEKKGVVYTKEWVVQFILDLAGYTSDQNLVDVIAIEPSAGEGAFLVAMAQRLISSCQRQNRPISDCMGSMIAFELDEASAAIARRAVADSIMAKGISEMIARQLASTWVRTGDYLFEAFGLPPADFVIGNPPYVRLEDIPEAVAGIYRGSYPTMMGRADLYIAFYEAALRQLKPHGVCAYICADRWMLNQYGAELRRLVTSAYAVETVIEMHEANAFHDDVSAYPAITVLRRSTQGAAVVASAGAEAEAQGALGLTQAVRLARTGQSSAAPGLALATVKTWFSDADPWPCSSPRRLALLRRLEEKFGPLETPDGSTKVGIGVATGLDEAFITTDAHLVEQSRLLPLALAKDTLTGHLKWSGHYLVDPWDSEGLVDLARHPRLAAHFGQYEKLLKKRHTAQKNSSGWYRTIDRVNHTLTQRAKLYIPDIKDQFNPVLDRGETYPHHNLYFIQSDEWDLEVLGGILLSSVAQLFIESYGVRMRGGYLRFQAQYLRRIRVPTPGDISAQQQELLRDAFRRRDRAIATAVTLKLYDFEAAELETSSGH